MVRELNLYVDGVATVSVAPPDVADRDELRALFDAACPGSAHEKDRASGVRNFWTMHTRSGQRSLRLAPQAVFDGLAAFINKRNMAPRPVDAAQLRAYVDEYHKQQRASAATLGASSRVLGDASTFGTTTPAEALDPSGSPKIADATLDHRPPRARVEPEHPDARQARRRRVDDAGAVSDPLQRDASEIERARVRPRDTSRIGACPGLGSSAVAALAFCGSVVLAAHVLRTSEP